MLIRSILSYVLRRRAEARTFSFSLTLRAATLCTDAFRPTSSTVFALSSGHGRCGVAVIRVSGPGCGEAVRRVCRQERLPRPRHAVLRRLFDPASTDVIDRGLVLWFPGPHSFTGEDCAEFQVHGGTAVIAAMLEALGSLPGLRPAEPGDFTKRAFLNGKMGLTEVEGLGDLIHAETAAQRRQALRQMEGDLGNLYADWSRRILKCLADVEAFIDFSEDENIEEDTLSRATAKADRIRQEVLHHLSDERKGERLRDGVRVAILGEPNVGKSSLLNRLCQRPAAIVSPVAGTTRDVVETALTLGGYPVLVSDTAGLRETGDEVEREGVRRALDRADKADVKVLLLDASHCLLDKPPNVSWPDFIINHMAGLGLDTCGEESSQESEPHTPYSPTTAPDSHAGHSDGCQLHEADFDAHGARLLGTERTWDSKSSTTNSLPADSLSSAWETGACQETESFHASGRETRLNSKLSDSGSADSSSVFRHNQGRSDSSVQTLKVGSRQKCILEKDVIVVLNKSDLMSSDVKRQVPSIEDAGVNVLFLSCATSDGLDGFVTALSDRVKQLCGDPLSGSPSLTQARHRTHLEGCQRHLGDYVRQVGRGGDLVLAAQALRSALREVGRVTGAVSVEDVLDVIFRDFCIGK